MHNTKLCPSNHGLLYNNGHIKNVRQTAICTCFPKIIKKKLFKILPFCFLYLIVLVLILSMGKNGSSIIMGSMVFDFLKYPQKPQSSAYVDPKKAQSPVS